MSWTGGKSVNAAGRAGAVIRLLDWLRLGLGLFLFALGTVLTLRAKLGLSPWDVLADGVRLRTPLAFGDAVIAIGVVLVVIAYIAGVRPGPGTLANMILIGAFEDVLLKGGFLTGLSRQTVVIRTAACLGGIAIVGLGSALYIGAQLGAGPRDSLMLATARQTHWRIGMARAAIEGSALVAGFLLGGTAGVGTILFAAGIGPAVDLWFRAFKMDSAGSRAKPT